MGLLSLLLAKDSPTPRITTVEATLWEGLETLEVVGESLHQDVLWKIVGGVRSDPVRYETHAFLIPEPDNPVDPNAIKVFIGGDHVGYLSREDAAAYRPGLLKLIEQSTNGLVALNATIVGGGPRPDGLGRLGVFLDHDPADFGIDTKPLPRGGSVTYGGDLRTGWSEAHLTWPATLSTSDATAIKQLRQLLAAETAPLDRHFMLSELERRLYKNRDAFSSALEEFDAVCAQHDAEMTAIRPTLLAQFGRVPVIDLYRQAAVRCQKARDWPKARYWAERGLSIYGSDAARPEAVEDLQGRLNRAIAKIKTQDKPTAKSPT